MTVTAPGSAGPRWPRRVALVAAAGLVPLLAACSADGAEAAAADEPTEAVSPEASPTAEPPESTGSADTVETNEPEPGPYDDEVVYDLLASFAPELDGFEHQHVSGAPQVDTAAGWSGSAAIEIEPPECVPIFAAIDLTTHQDLGAAQRDAVDPGNNYVPVDGDSDDPNAPYINLFTRVFADQGLAAAVIDDALASGCERYTTDVPEFDAGSDRTVATLETVTLAGVDEESLHILIDPDVSFGGGEAGPATATEYYVHVDGPNAIVVLLANVADPAALAGDAIAAYVDHMGGS